jgi:hypothetical protein
VSSSRYIDWFCGNVLIPARASGTHLALNFGGGVLIPAWPRISVRADIRWPAFVAAGDDFYHVTHVTAGTAIGF